MWPAKRDTTAADTPLKSSAEHSIERRRRYEPAAIYEFAASLRRRGIDLASRTGPWRAVGHSLGRTGRNGLAVLPIVTNGLAQLMADTMEHATDLAGLLNWCGVDDLDPVPDLVPPPALRYQLAGQS